VNNKYELNKYNMTGVLVRSCTGILGQLCYFMVIYTSNISGVSFSIIYSLFAMTPFITVIIFYFLFNEKVRITDALGIIILSASAVVIS
jgi:drug/metabolite transporter (DMT)-like permease